MVFFRIRGGHVDVRRLPWRDIVIGSPDPCWSELISSFMCRWRQSKRNCYGRNQAQRPNQPRMFRREFFPRGDLQKSIEGKARRIASWILRNFGKYFISRDQPSASCSMPPGSGRSRREQCIEHFASPEQSQICRPRKIYLRMPWPKPSPSATRASREALMKEPETLILSGCVSRTQRPPPSREVVVAYNRSF